MSETIFDKQGTILNIKPASRLDAVTSPALEREMSRYLDNVQEIIMDFANVEYISSGGIRVLLATEQKMKDRGGRLRLIHVNELIVEVFELVGFMDLVETETE
ncbi:MAG: STAS domain-containing protein [Clostridia bacterium]|nr:STAS domain-containing protein [Clostridia bacterium]